MILFTKFIRSLQYKFKHIGKHKNEETIKVIKNVYKLLTVFLILNFSFDELNSTTLSVIVLVITKFVVIF